jgi:hypothetical protein
MRFIALKVWTWRIPGCAFITIGQVCSPVNNETRWPLQAWLNVCDHRCRTKRCKLHCSVKDLVVVANHVARAPGGTLMVTPAVQGMILPQLSLYLLQRDCHVGEGLHLNSERSLIGAHIQQSGYPLPLW